MEYIMCCEICFFEYKEDDVIPKILSCGHSYCSLCIKKLIESSKICPKCRKEMNQDIKVEEYPTNYSLLDSLKMVGILESNMGSSKHLLKKKIETNKEILSCKIIQTSKILIEAKKDLDELQNLTDSRNEIIDLQKTKLVLDTLDRKNNTENCSAYFKKVRDSVTYNIADFRSSEDYLNQIYKKIRREESIHTVKIVDHFIKYGKVSLQENMILCHALCETEKPDKASLIWFDDLKDCVTENNFFPFLKLSCNEKEVIRMVEIKMLNSRLASKFISLCTGECGYTYKRLRYQKYIKDEDPRFCGILNLEEGCIMSSIRNKQFDYNTTTFNDVHFHKDDEIVAIGDGTSLKICRIFDTVVISDAVGKLESPKNLENFITFDDFDYLNVVDCGLIFKI